MSLLTSAATTNQVLQLDGNDSYVELPPDLFNDLEEATVEGWVRWESFRDNSHFFEFGDDQHGVVVYNSGTTSDLAVKIRGPQAGDFKASRVQRNQWHHIGLVASAAGLTLYLDGMPVGAAPFAGRFSSVAGGKVNFLGSSLFSVEPVCSLGDDT